MVRESGINLRTPEADSCESCVLCYTLQAITFHPCVAVSRFSMLIIASSSSTGLHTIDWGILVVYVAATLGLGWYFGRKQGISAANRRIRANIPSVAAT